MLKVCLRKASVAPFVTFYSGNAKSPERLGEGIEFLW
mgnify:CR=1 FL=1